MTFVAEKSESFSAEASHEILIIQHLVAWIGEAAIAPTCLDAWRLFAPSNEVVDASAVSPSIPEQERSTQGVSHEAAS